MQRRAEIESVIQIRRMAARDTDHVLSLVREIKEMPQWPREEFGRIANSQPSDRLYRPAWVAHSGKLLVGFAAACFLPAEDVVELEAVAVQSAHRGKGIGGQLLKVLMSEAEAGGANLMYLEVRASNVAAVNLYQRHGFYVSGRRKEYYREPLEDALCFKMRLDKLRVIESTGQFQE